MSKGLSGLFHGTMGTTHVNGSQTDTTYADRGIEIPEHIKQTISKLNRKGDYVSSDGDNYPIKDVSIMSKETGVEYAKLSIGGKSYLIRGDKNGVDVPGELLSKLTKEGGKFDFHSHPYDNDCIPSARDRETIRRISKATGQKTSQIVTPNGRTVIFDQHGVIETGNVSNIIDNEAKETYMKLFGGK